jgi:hypothetical protein
LISLKNCSTKLLKLISLFQLRVDGMLAQTRPYWQSNIVGGFSLRPTIG